MTSKPSQILREAARTYATAKHWVTTQRLELLQCETVMEAAKAMCAADDARRHHEAALSTINDRLAPVLAKFPGYTVRIDAPGIVTFDLSAWANKLQGAFRYERPLLPTELLIGLETDQRLLLARQRNVEQVARALIDGLVETMPKPPTRNEVVVVAIATGFDPPITYETPDRCQAEFEVRGDRWRKKTGLVGPIFDLYQSEEPEALSVDRDGRYFRGVPSDDWEDTVNSCESENGAGAPASNGSGRPAGNS